MTQTEVILVPVLSDNYAYIMTKGEHVAIIDPGQPEPILNELKNRGLTPTMILNTHHHSDHIAGNEAIIKEYNAHLIGPEKETARIPAMNKTVSEGDTIDFGGEPIHVIETPGHTSGHICFHLPESNILFSGDLLFAMGCGRAFEGTPEELHASIEKVKALPVETTVYCGHEYTQSNAEFCLSIEPDNQALIERTKRVKQYRDNNMPTIPFTLAEELETNCFIRAENAAQFTEYRLKKDNF